MKIDIIDKKDESLFQRETITAKCEFDNATPSRLELRNRLAAQLGVKENLVVIKNVFTDFGARSGRIEACVYKSEEALKKVESEKMIKKHTPKQEEKPAEEAAPAEKKEEAPAEKPAEEKKEEKPEAA
ncbi:hypothetical protein KY326_00525 [Candidatus Woesearchaeota archaeon]|nr:hypothetical protein [Candidatus Woesearchaeota archaeon]